MHSMRQHSGMQFFTDEATYYPYILQVFYGDDAIIKSITMELKFR